MAGILSMFAASPFKPLRKHMEKVSECCGCIKALIEKTLSGNIDKNTQIAERIRLLEIDANRLKYRQEHPDRREDPPSRN